MSGHSRPRRWGAVSTLLMAALFTGCGGSKNVEASKSPEPAAPPPTQVPVVRTVKAEARAVGASVQATGTFVAKEASDVAPRAAGRVSEAPVDVGAFVQQGQVIARLEDRDAQLRLEQATAAEQQAEAALRQAQSRIGLGPGEQFNPDNVPEVLSAKATFDSAQAQAKQVEADARRY